MRLSVLLLTFSGFFSLFCGAPAFGASAPYWQWRNPTPQGNDYYDVTYGGGRFVAVGPAGTITTSTDGITWSQANSGVNGYLSSVAYGNGRYIIVGFGNALISEDGVSWNRTSLPREGNVGVSGVTFAGDRFFGMSNVNYTLRPPQMNYVVTSTDGINWTKSDTASAANVGRIAYGGGTYLAQDMTSGELSSSDGITWPIYEAKMVRSTDGVTWTPGGGTGLARVSGRPIYANGRWVVGGILATQGSNGKQQFQKAVSTSTDGGLTWTVEWSDSRFTTLEHVGAYKGRVYLLGDPNDPLISTADFVTARSDLPPQMLQLNAMAASADRVVAVGRYGQILSSGDGTNWTSHTGSTVSGNLRAAAFGDGQWMVAGQSGLAASSDGISWSMLPSGATFDTGSLAYGNGRFVASDMTGRIAVSTDKGATWSDSATRSIVMHFAFANGRFVGSTGLISSTDGLTWTAEIPAPGGTGRWLGVFTVGDVFYAVGTTDPDQTKDYVIARSTDGLSWTTVATMPERVLSVGGKEDLIIASGDLGEVWTSTDGFTWTKANGRPLLSFGPISSSQWVGDSFVGATYHGQIVMSPDGVNWAKDEFASSGMMWGLAAGNGQVLAVGNGGVIWEVGAARFTQQPESRTVAVGSPVTLSVAATGKEPLSYQWQKNGSPISGATKKSYAIMSASAGDAGDYRVVVSNSLGSTTSNPASLVIGQTIAPPHITSHPQSKTVNTGDSVTFSVGAGGDAPLTFQWYHNNALVAGATDSSYTIPFATTADNGTYMVNVWNDAGIATSHNATLSVNAPPASRLVSIATRAYATTDNGVTIGGFVIDGNSPKQVLMRAVGPSLSTQGLPSTELLADPTIELHHKGSILATNDNWGDNTNAAAIAETGLRIGATPLDASDTQSAAMLMTLDPGVYTFIAKGKNNSSGIVLIEVYDADIGGSSFAGIASRALSTTNNNVAIGGFVVAGTAPKQVLMRAVGSSLATQGLPRSELLLDPTIELHRGSTILATNDNWGDNDNAAAIVTEGARIGATPLGANDTKSAVLLMTLQPGVYSFIVKGANNSAGLVLVEVYDAD